MLLADALHYAKNTSPNSSWTSPRLPALHAAIGPYGIVCMGTASKVKAG